MEQQVRKSQLLKPKHLVCGPQQGKRLLTAPRENTRKAPKTLRSQRRKVYEDCIKRWQVKLQMQTLSISCTEQ